MVEAVRTTASPAAIWTICVVAVACLAFWLSAIAYADAHPKVRHRRLPDMPGPVLGGIHVADSGGRSVSPNRVASASLADAGAAAPAGETAAQETAAQEAGQPRVPAQAGPGQRGPQAPAEPVPAQRTASAGTVRRGAAPAGTAAEDSGADSPAAPIPAQRAEPDQRTAADTTGPGATGQR
jgi:hypothetical protein